jgi:D-alanyl-D-alanine carboxypeptidase
VRASYSSASSAATTGRSFGFNSEAFYLPAKDAVIVINVNRLDKDDQSQSAELFLSLTKELFPEEVNW